MARPHFETVSAYIAAQPPAVRTRLRRVRSTIRKSVPDADEMISYGIPAYKLRGRVLIYFAGFKNHYSIYPFSASLAKALASQIRSYEYNNKGTIRFPLDRPVPVRLVASIAKARAKDVVSRL